ncbi:MAG: hypothetical protein ACRDRH_22075 [Pseudonocardia sp.]
MTITGTRSIGDVAVDSVTDAFNAYLRPFAAPDAHFYLGGATGSIPLPWTGWPSTPGLS